jgi:hypothetical protein
MGGAPRIRRVEGQAPLILELRGPLWHSTMPTPIDVFFSYAPEDEALREELEKRLALLRRSGLIRAFCDRRIGAGEEWKAAMDEGFRAARLILLLVSADFLASDYCCGVEVQRALERHRAGDALVIPVILRVCDWKNASFADLAAFPQRIKAVTSAPNRDEAWEEVVSGIRAEVAKLQAKPAPSYPDAETQALCEQIERARARRQALAEHGADPAVVDREIRELRRQLREGGQLRAGDALGNGRYLLLNQVGKGGFAIVWEALDRERGERVAVKVLHSNLAGDRIRFERFFRGARTMAELGHEGVVRVLEQRGEDGGYHYFVMEFIAGDDLRQAVLKKTLAGEAVIPVILRVGETLAFAHRKGLVHRDIKPANILLDVSGSPRLTDFDLVGGGDTTGGTKTGALGTVVYTAPEITDRPQDADARADVYSLGMTAVFALHGAELTMLVVMRGLEKLIDKLPCDEAVKGVLKQAVDCEKEARFADAGAFCEALREAAAPASAQVSGGVPVGVPCNAVIFTRGGGSLVSGYGDGSIRLWQGANMPGQRVIAVRVFKAHEGAVTSLAISPRGSILASGSADETIGLWSLGNHRRGKVLPEPMGILVGHLDSVWSVAFSPDGATLASGSGDKTLRLWDIAHGAEPRVLRGHEGSVRCVAWSPDGRILASDFADETLEIWNMASGAAQDRLQKFAHSGWGVAFNPDGNHLVTGFREDTIMVLNLEERVGIFAAQSHHKGLVQSVAWSPDGATMASGSKDKTIRLWNRLLEGESWQTLAVKRVLEGHTQAVTSVAFSPDGATLASASKDGTVRLWDVASGACRAVLT